jgi:hypothetical protein
LLQAVYQFGGLVPVLVGGICFDREQADVEPALLLAVRQAIEVLQPVLSQPICFLMREELQRTLPGGNTGARHQFVVTCQGCVV